MKKNLLLASFALLAMTSCSDDETVSVNQDRAISFRTSLQTRAAEMKTEDVNDIIATAFEDGKANLFQNVKFSKKGEGFFESETPYFWPSKGQKLNIFAYAPSDLKTGSANISHEGQKITGFEPEENISEQIDFVMTDCTKGSSENEKEGLPLELKHRLSQIEIQAKNTNTGYTFEVVGVRIGSVVKSGDYDASKGTWKPGSEKSKYQTVYETAHKLGKEPVSLMDQAESKVNGNAMLIPQKLTKWDPQGDNTNKNGGSYLAVKLKITSMGSQQIYPVGGGNEYDWAAIPVDTDWAPGKKYVYVLDFSEGAGKVDPDPENPNPDPFEPGDDILGGVIKFTVTVSDWISETVPTPMK